MREMERLSGIAVGSLAGELAKLHDLGVLRRQRNGNRLYFQSNPEHPLYPELHGMVLKTSGLEAQLTRALNGVSGIAFAFVFGSFANNGAGPQSDVDVFVVGSAGLRQLAPRLRVVADELGREVNPYVISPGALIQKIKDKDAFVGNVLTSPKRWVIGDEHAFKRLVE